MSLIANDSGVGSSTDTPLKIILKTGEQYNIWKARISSACWALTRADVFSLTDEQCVQMMEARDAAEGKDVRGGFAPDIYIIGKCWSVLTSHLSDDLFLKTAHVKKGHIATLIAEIRASLAVSTVVRRLGHGSL